MEVEFEANSSHEIIEQMQKIGYDFNWQQTYHFHAAPENHSLWHRIHFRNYLIKLEIAQRYEELIKQKVLDINMEDFSCA